MATIVLGAFWSQPTEEASTWLPDWLRNVNTDTSDTEEPDVESGVVGPVGCSIAALILIVIMHKLFKRLLRRGGAPKPETLAPGADGAGEGTSSRPFNRRAVRKQSALDTQAQSMANFNRGGSPDTADVHHQWSVRRILLVCLIAAFFLSVPWEFVRLYQQAVAKRAARAEHSLPAECRPESMSVSRWALHWLLYPFRWENPECQRYHEDMLTDPLWEVTPIVVLCSLLSRCVLTPLDTICHGLGEGVRLLLHKVPWQWQPVIMILMAFVVIITVAMVMGYRIEFPWLVRLVPARSDRPRPVVVKVRPMRQRMAAIDLTRDSETEESDYLDSSGEVSSPK